MAITKDKTRLTDKEHLEIHERGVRIGKAKMLGSIQKLLMEMEDKLLK